MSVGVKCVEVTKRFGTQRVLDRVSWAVEPGSVAGLIGASGAGKTTLLRIVAGLEAASAGAVWIDRVQPAAATGPVRVGMVFQNSALWPHLSARQHLRCVLASLPRLERRRRIETVFAETRFPAGGWDRRPSQLSGGEAQRLALARALAPRPELLLLDEPLAQLDGPLRAELLALIRQVVHARGVTAIYVTHDSPEAMELCQRIAVMRAGQIAAAGTPEELYWHPGNADLARLTGPVVALPRAVLEAGLVSRPPGTPSDKIVLCLDSGDLLVRPQQLRLGEPSGEGFWEVVHCQPQGLGWRATVVHGDHRLVLPSAHPVPLGHRAAIQLEPIPRK